MIVNSLYDKSILLEDYYPKVQAYYFREWNMHIGTTDHKHNQMEIMYVLSGNCIIKGFDWELSMKKGDLIFIDADVPHSLMVEKNKPCRMLNIEFIFEKIIIEYPSLRLQANSCSEIKDLITCKVEYIKLRDSEEVYHAIKSIILELDKGKCESDLIIQVLFSELFIQISKLVKELNYGKHDLGMKYVNKAIQYICENYDCEIKISDIAKKININQAYLQRLFKVKANTTIIEYLNRIRVEKSKMMLANTNIPIIDICNYVGINSRQYFSKAFKRYTGESPAEYRKRSSRTNY